MTTAALASLLPLPVVLPITGAVIAPLAARVSRRAPLVVSVIAMAGAAAVLAVLAPRVYRGRVITEYVGHVRPVGGSVLGVTLAADPFGLAYALLAAAVGGLLLIYTLSELGGLGQRELGGYACLFQLLLAALIGSALTADSVDLFVWFEVAALASYGLTGFFLERPLALEAALKIMILTNIAAFCVFIGAALLYSDHGALNFGQLHSALSQHTRDGDLLALGLLIAGFGTKAGLVPFHGWLADAHTAAPGPVSALFSGLMVNLGVLAIARYALQVFATSGRPVLGLLTVLGAVSAVGGAVLALAQDDFKRVLAYDTVSQMGVLVVGLSTGTTAGVAGMVYHLINHALFKTLLFLCAGSVVHATGMTKLSQMGGLVHHRKLTTAAFLVGAAAIAGVPPLNGYVSLGLIHDSLRSGHPVAFIAMIVAQVITVAALARATYLAFFRQRDEDYDSLEKSEPGMLIALGTLAAGCVAFGLLPTEVLDHIVSPAAAVLTEPAAYSHALLTGTAPLRLPHLTFPYFAFSELATSLGTLLAGLGLAWYYVRLPREPRVIAAIRRLHTGSVNDYALYAAGGLLISIVVMVTQ